MHGIIFSQLRKFAVEAFGAETWDAALSDAGLDRLFYLTTENYPDDEVVRIVAALSARTDRSPTDLYERFGRAMVPDLMRIYGHLVDPAARTLEFLCAVEETIHRVVRIRNAGATPPEIRCNRDAPRQATVTYASPRRMCALARGLIRGVADHYGETVSISDRRCMHRGDEACELVVTVRTTSRVPKVPAGTNGAA